MEIREGIKYKTSHGEPAEIFAHSKVHNFYAKFYGGGISTNYTSKEWIKDFQTGKLQLLEYPYKVGDWVYCIDDKYFLDSPQITQITNISQGTSLLIYVNNETYYQKIEDFNENYRPCFKEEIPNYKQEKVVKENYDYLIPILIELDE